MTKLYSKLAHVYHEMYQSIFDYGREFRRFDSIFKKHACNRVLEIGCGAGDLAPLFLAGGYDYTGVDVSAEMLRIARSEVPSARFVQGDMRRLSFRRKFDAVLIGGRSFTYMTTNQDVRSALQSTGNALKSGGILVFDNFDAEAIFKNLRNRFHERVVKGSKTFVRQSETSMNLKAGWTWNWNATYIVDDGRRKRTFHDHSVLRAFTRDELRLFLVLTGFTPLKSIRRSATILIVARRT